MTGTFMFPRNAFLGFDHLFDELEKITNHANDTYPPHNVIKSDDMKYDIELAVAGFSKDDITIELKEHVLYIKGDREKMMKHMSTKAYQVESSQNRSDYQSTQKSVVLI